VKIEKFNLPITAEKRNSNMKKKGKLIKYTFTKFQSNSKIPWQLKTTLKNFLTANSGETGLLVAYCNSFYPICILLLSRKLKYCVYM